MGTSDIYWVLQILPGLGLFERGRGIITLRRPITRTQKLSKRRTWLDPNCLRKVFFLYNTKSWIVLKTHFHIFSFGFVLFVEFWVQYRCNTNIETLPTSLDSSNIIGQFIVGHSDTATNTLCSCYNGLGRFNDSHIMGPTPRQTDQQHIAVADETK